MHDLKLLFIFSILSLPYKLTALGDLVSVRSQIENGAELRVSERVFDVVRFEMISVNYTIKGDFTDCVDLVWRSIPDNITTIPDPIRICAKDLKNSDFLPISFETESEGIVTLVVEAHPKEALNTEDAFVDVSVGLSSAIYVISDVFGWIYTIAWDISFVPQIIHNWRRKSVVGLSFDFLVFNFIGFSCYGLFNIGLLWIPGIKEQYALRNPYSINHVRLNDVIFPLYAVVCTSVQLLQCLFYERGNQRVSTTCMILSVLMIVSIAVYAILVAAIGSILWIDLLYWLSYVKLFITCIKYTPQLYANYKLKSTEGWNIWQVILDCTGGSFSLIQMFLLSYNFNDYESLLTDPTKLGLGLLSIFFNIFFFAQHYCLYRNNTIQDDKEEIKLENSIEKF